MLFNVGMARIGTAEVGGSDDISAVMEARFTGPSLLAMVALIVVVFAQVAVVGGLVAEALGLFSPEARGGGDRILANTATVWLAMSGLACLLTGSVLLIVEAQRPTPTTATGTTTEVQAQSAGFVELVTGLSETFAKLKGGRAALFAGVILLVTAGVIANGSVPT